MQRSRTGILAAAILTVLATSIPAAVSAQEMSALTRGSENMQVLGHLPLALP